MAQVLHNQLFRLVFGNKVFRNVGPDIADANVVVEETPGSWVGERRAYDKLILKESDIIDVRSIEEAEAA